LITVDGADQIFYDRHKLRNPVPDTLDAQIVIDAARFLQEGEKMQLQYAVQNTSRSIGTRISSHIVTKFGMHNNLQSDHLTIKLEGSAGQALGAFAAPGLKLEVAGEANDYVGKGLSGGTIVIRPAQISPLVAAENTIIGNTVLYGATDGYLFAAGRAGERFAVRNSGAKTVIEGCGSNGCEYMTGGVTVVLGSIGANFGAGMTGGMAYLYDPMGSTELMMNMETLVTCPVTVPHWQQELKDLVTRHVKETGSLKAADILQHWDQERHKFVQVCPKEMLVHLPAPLSYARAQSVPAE
jgi:glutamate synthase (NADPH/NADH) large chain